MSFKKILIITPSWIGDCVMTQPLYQRLHEQHPNCQIDVFAPKWTMAVFKHMPEIHNIIENPFKHGILNISERWQMGRKLGKNGYDQVIVLANSFKSAIVAAGTQAKQRTGYIGEMRYILLNDLYKLNKQKHPLMVDRYTALAGNFIGTSSQPRLTINPDHQNRALAKYNLKKEGKVMALCAGAEYGPAKRWPPEHFATIAQHYAQLGWQIWLFGSQKDFDISEKINQLSGELCVNLCGKTNLDEAIDLLACADGVICNDSGLMHLAAAVGIKLVAVYGSSSPEHTPPLSHTAKIATLNLDCSPCFERVCPLKHTDCLQKLSPEKIIHLHQELDN